MTRLHLTDAQYAEIRALAGTLSLTTIAKRYSVSRETVRRIIRDTGRVTPAPPPVDPQQLDEEYRHFAAFGWSDERIAQRLGIHPDTLQQHLRRRKETV